MSQDVLERFLGRMMTDDLFRHRAMKSVEAACREDGFQLTVEEMILIRKEDIAFCGMIAENLDPGIKRYRAEKAGGDEVWEGGQSRLSGNAD